MNFPEILCCERILMLNILIIEDDIGLRQRIKSILISKLPFLYVAEASNEKDSFSEIEKSRPDLVIMDIHLAVENGLNLTKMIKMRYPSIPIETTVCTLGTSGCTLLWWYGSCITVTCLWPFFSILFAAIFAS